jgi:hypothetical protein
MMSPNHRRGAVGERVVGGDDDRLLPVELAVADHADAARDVEEERDLLSPLLHELGGVDDDESGDPEPRCELEGHHRFALSAGELEESAAVVLDRVERFTLNGVVRGDELPPVEAVVELDAAPDLDLRVRARAAVHDRERELRRRGVPELTRHEDVVG